MTEPANVLLSGIVGSTAYGLATPESDVDRLGVFAVPTARLHGIHTPKDSIVTTNPDVTYHEAAKWARLALGCNPTAMELAWLPDDLYETRTDLGDQLITIRSAFLSAKRVRDAYLGYATQQFRRLEARGDGSFSADTRRRTAKHARHLARLVHQGLGLYRTGRLQVRLDDPAWYRDFGEQVAGGDLQYARKVLAQAEADFDRTTTPLPGNPDERPVDAWLARVRQAHYEPPTTDSATVVPGCFLVDLDGTLALRDETDPNVRAFYHWDRVGEDHPNTPVVTVVQALAAAGHRIVYLSGRSEVCRRATSAWLATHIGVPGEDLHMRAEGDNRPDEIVKKELYERRVRPYHDVTAVLDDRNKVVAMWRKLGLTVLQVADGDF